MNWNIPPKIKVYEAFSAIADGRFVITGNEAIVTSSNLAKTYTVKWQDTIPLTITSNDNGSYWMDYAGYPIITVLMAQGKISYNQNIISYFKNIDWNALNKKVDNDYDVAIQKVLNDIKNVDDKLLIVENVQDILKQIATLELQKLGNRPEQPPV